MICCGSGSDFFLVLVLVPAPVPVRLRFWFRSQTISITVTRNRKSNKILPFQCQKQLVSHKVGLSFSIFWLFYYILCWIRIQSGFRSGTVTLSGSGSFEAKSYSSCGSGSGSTTLNNRQETKAPLKHYGGIGPLLCRYMYYFSMDDVALQLFHFSCKFMYVIP